MTDWKKKWEEELDKNCNKCGWCIRNTSTLLESCSLGKKITNTWTTAHDCKNYSDVSKITKKTPNKQLDLFINNF